MTKHLKIVLEQWGAVLEPTRPFGSQRGGGQKVQNSSLVAYFWLWSPTPLGLVVGTQDLCLAARTRCIPDLPGNAGVASDAARQTWLETPIPVHRHCYDAALTGFRIDVMTALTRSSRQPFASSNRQISGPVIGFKTPSPESVCWTRASYLAPS